jgi:hypothetical protein
MGLLIMLKTGIDKALLIMLKTGSDKATVATLFLIKFLREVGFLMSVSRLGNNQFT